MKTQVRYFLKLVGADLYSLAFGLLVIGFFAGLFVGVPWFLCWATGMTEVEGQIAIMLSSWTLLIVLAGAVGWLTDRWQEAKKMARDKADT